MFEKTRKMLRRWTDAATDSHPEDRRLHPRYEIDLETVCRLAVPGAPDMGVRVRNISRGGVNLRLEKPLDEGSLIVLEMPRNDSDTTVTVLACVMHAVPLPDGHFGHGCTFSSELDDDDLDHFGARRERTDGRDNRVWKRFPTQGTAQIQRVPVEGEPTFAGRISNISPSGVGLIVGEVIEPGTALRLELQRQDAAPSVSILACAVYLGEHSEQGWVVGCNFIHELTSHDLTDLMQR